MLCKLILLAVIGASAGMIVSGGVFTVLISVGLIPRFAGKMHVARRIFILEEMVVFGTLMGGYASIFNDWSMIGQFVREHHIFGTGATDGIWNFLATILLLLYGLFAGIFVGCLALAIAEMLNTIPIFARRVGFRHGLGVAILAVALGKLTGSRIYFTPQVYLYGGK